MDNEDKIKAKALADMRAWLRLMLLGMRKDAHGAAAHWLDQAARLVGNR
jgi:hypothetical protein